MLPNSQSTTLSIHVRWFIRKDLPEALSIEWAKDCPEWDEEEFLRALRQRNVIGMVAEDCSIFGKEKIVGFMVYELHKKSVELLNIGAEVGEAADIVIKKMLDKLIGKLSSHRRQTATMMVRESDLFLLNNLKAAGFMAVKVERDCFTTLEGSEDGILMEYRLTRTESEAGADWLELEPE